MAETISQDLSAQAQPSHPEEMKGNVTLRIGDRTILEASGRLTPAGIVSAGVTLAVVMVAFGFLIRSGRAAPLPRRR